ncbi:MAG TPA: protein kinase, partial [Myxococcaceae bacterium]|nr:protein kinase [Myxococcaceae bacterium]
MSDTGRGPPETADDDEAVARAVEAASSVALQRFRALMESGDATGHPVNTLVDGLQTPRHGPGDLVRQYRILRELGSGGMGSVFLAERADGQFRRQVALKVLRGFPTEDGKRRLRSERQVLAELDHPGIAKLLDGGETADGQPFLVLEYVEGETLHAAVARGQLDLGARVTLAERIAEAVAHAHQRLVVHRDLKPNNVMVTRDGTPRLLDFGVARLLTEIGDEQSTRVYTPGYASPEQIAGGRIITRTDVYALGVLLHELVTGTRFDGRPLDPPLPQVRPDLDLRGIARKAAAEDADERYPSADAFLDDLRRWRAGLPVRARPDTALYRTARFVRRHQKAVAVAVLVLAITAGLLVRLQRENRRALRAEAASTVETLRAKQEAARAGRLLEFINQTFEAAAPDNARGKPLSASELVADARRRVELAVVSDADRPDVLGLLAEIAGRIGDTKQSLELAAAALEALPPATDRNGARRSARLLELHSRLLSGAGQLKEGVETARRAEVLVQTFAPDDAQVRDEAAVHLGFALSSNLDLTARPILERFADGRSSLTDPTVPIEASRSLVSLSLHSKDGPRALEDARRSWRLVESLPPGHPYRSDALYQEASVLQELGRYDDALPLMRQSIAEYEKAFGPRGGKMA